LENSNYIIPVGFQIIKQSCKFIVDMKKNNFDIEMVSINITLKQLIDPMFIINFKRILRETHCDPRWLEFEITERTIMSHLREAIDIIHIIRSIGVKIAIDDFGTGESSLSLIHELPIDKLKIDKSFIDKINDQGFLTLTIIDIAKNIGATVIAEGVEYQYQADFLKANGCYEIQGYLYSKPISIEELKALCPQSEYILI
jgi:EAL domain-containing protein (putative c-di-GMP-specific phosphodiesterase class I)